MATELITYPPFKLFGTRAVVDEDLEVKSCSRETALTLRLMSEAIEVTSLTVAAASAMSAAAGLSQCAGSANNAAMHSVYKDHTTPECVST